MTAHPTHATPEATEREAREAVHAITDVGHKMTCSSVEFIKPDNFTGLDKYGSSGKACDCGADAKREATLDAYAAAVRRAERERIAGIVEGMRVLAANERDYYFSLRHVEPPYTDKDECYVIERNALLAKLREAK